MDKITILDFEVYYRVGVPDGERASPQRLLLTVELDHDLERAAATDDLAATIDYSAICVRLAGFGEGRQWRLIERLASDIAAMVIEDFKAKSVSVEVKKFVIPQARYVSVRVRRPMTTSCGLEAPAVRGKIDPPFSQ